MEETLISSLTTIGTNTSGSGISVVKYRDEISKVIDDAISISDQYNIVMDLNEKAMTDKIKSFLINEYKKIDQVSRAYFRKENDRLLFIVFTSNESCDIPLLRSFDRFEIAAEEMFPNLKIDFEHRLEISKTVPANAEFFFQR